MSEDRAYGTRARHLNRVAELAAGHLERQPGEPLWRFSARVDAEMKQDPDPSTDPWMDTPGPGPNWRALRANEAHAREIGLSVSVPHPDAQESPGWQADAEAWGPGRGVGTAEMEREA